MLNLPDYANQGKNTFRLNGKLSRLKSYNFNKIEMNLVDMNNLQTYENKEFNEIFTNDVELAKIYYYYSIQLKNRPELKELFELLSDLDVLPELLNNYDNSVWNR